MKKIHSSVMLALILISTLTIAFSIQPVKATDGPIYIRADGSIDPPTAPIQRDGNLYTFTADIYDSIVVERDNIVIDGAGYTLQGTGSETGIDLSGRTNVTIKNINVRGFHMGFCLDLSLSNTLSGNNITNNDYAIYLDSSSQNTFSRNIITRNDAGIWLDSSSSNIFSRNNLMNNLVDFHLLNSVGNTLSGNNITDGSVGIRLQYATRYNRIFENNIANNGQGVEVLQLGPSIDYNAFYHNNFVNNAIQVRFTQFSEDIWDEGYPSGGNYWSDYSGKDTYSGPYQNVTGADGIGDTPYIIDDRNQDRYPLMNPWVPPSPDFSLTASPTSLILQKGDLATSTITIASVNGFDQPVQLTVSGAPTGVTTTLGPEQVIPPPDGSTTSTLTVSVDTPATTGSYTLTVTGMSDTLTHSVAISLEITAQPPPVDTTPPTTPVVTDDGEYTSSTTWLHATWSSSDPESGITEYQYAIGASPGGTDVIDWTSAGTATEITRQGLNLIIGATYYFSVKAKNGKGLWSEIGTSDGITVTTITFDLSPGWENKELFVPIFYRSREEPGTFVLGAHNRRDMWYLVKVYKKMPDKTWMEIIPDEFLRGAGPYLGPWSERTFLYTPQMGDEIKIQVWNDMNDGTLMALWSLDFVTRVLTGVRIPPKFVEYTDWQTLKSKLNDFYNDVVKPVKDDLLSKAWKSALIEICKAILKAPQLYSSILIDLGFEPSVAAGIIVKIGKFVEGALRLFAFFVNIPTWKNLLENLNKEPFMEEVTFAARYKAPFVAPNVKVTESLTIVQKEPYYVGQTIDAQFTVINKGTAPITFNVLTVGGRGPKGEVDIQDFTFRTDITLNPGGSYNYKGELKLLDNGTYHFFIAYQTSDGKWETSVPTETGITNTLDIFVNSIPEKWVAAELGSPAELRVFDSQGRVTGTINGEEKTEIPYSAYYENIVVILAPADSYRYEVVGTSEGSYSLALINATVTVIFNATNIPTSTGAIHRYTVDWAALSQGQKGVTVQIDSNGDGIFEKTFNAGSELTRDEFISQVYPSKGSPMWIIGVTIAIIAIVTAATAVFWRKRRQHPTEVSEN